MEKNYLDWIIRFVKGIFIGTGFILPGVSGGALAAVFGIYERAISFIAHMSRDFVKNVLFFIPVGLGMLFGVMLLSYPLSYLLENYFAPTMWFFIGAIAGTLPLMWKQAGEKGREPKHIVIMIIALILGFLFMYFSARLIDGQMPLNFGTWILAGAIIALGVLVPGLSPTNFLLFMGMYDGMVTGFKTLDLSILIPMAIGGAVCLLIFAKVVNKLFEKAYAGLFHAIFGIVVASTLMIIPTDYNYFSLGALVCAAACIVGIALGLWMSALEKKYKPAESESE
ncbi:hypothetical protein MmiHf6_04380 [Methanimicrococcus hongohii]|uniref:DUF368 domain-containing protein n=1 Tax=Methanimicrococcus hongohii TaxID=3028295 RepID=A0AA96ZS78_9EURY|nr:DUF368 domain-containing protein [Methanimicrococcus sp. Hf6]WNY23135.1 hypothetical protein MmiHf6_04380 [Methanimicrococcus sp. Hf6]